MTRKIALLYVPVIHSGYLRFFEEFEKHGGKDVWLLGSEVINDWSPTHKDLHALDVEQIRESLELFFPKLDIQLLESKSELVQLWENREEERTKKFAEKFVVPSEEAMRSLVEELKIPTEQVEWQNIFLRWDKKKAVAVEEPQPDGIISDAEFDRKMMALAVKEGELSADWWRQVGAVLVRDGKVILIAHNRHLPHEQQPNVDGDIRGQFHKGEHWDLGTAIHAEADLIARAAGEGIFVAGAELYVTDFPCPNCAKLIARSGITKLYFKKGYAVSDGERVLRSAGVEIIRVVDRN